MKVCNAKTCVALIGKTDQFCAIHRERGPAFTTEAGGPVSAYCEWCDGTGKCDACDGEGEHRCECGHAHECEACDATGECKQCRDERQSNWDAEYLAWSAWTYQPPALIARPWEAE